jgi:hypothetical protein
MNSLIRGRTLFGAGALVVMLAANPSNAAVTISAGVTSNMNCTGGVCTPTAANAVLNVGDLQTMLASSNVTVNTGTGTLAQQVEDIVVTASFNWASASSLTLDAYRSVTVNAPIAVNGSAAVSLVTNDGGSGGNLSFVSGGNLSFMGTTNGLSINGKSYALVSTIAKLAADVAGNPSGQYALSTSYDASRDGTFTASPVTTHFRGTFQGMGNVISNLAITNGATKGDLGLFAHNDPTGTLANVVLQNETVTASKSGENLGGLVARNEGILFGDAVSGHLTAQQATRVGGVVGWNEGSVLRSSASAQVAGVAYCSVGGLMGFNDGTLDESFASGSIKVRRNDSGGGGLVGFSQSGAITSSYATGTVKQITHGESSPVDVVGGLIGTVTGGTVSSSYSTGGVSGGQRSAVGGFAGVNLGALSNDYWDTTTSGTNVGVASGSGTGVTGQTTTQLQTGLPSGFGPAIWAESPSINNGLPYLIANPPQ